MTDTTTRKGPKPNPFVRLQKAQEKAAKARLAVEKVQGLIELKDAAEREEQEAIQALKEAVEATGVSAVA